MSTYEINIQNGRGVIIGDGATGSIGFSQRSIPLQRPRRAEHFTNRNKELAQLLQELQPGRVVTLCGPGGMGKSALAAEAIWQLTQDNQPPQRFPDGVIWHDFYQEPQVAKALEHIALSFGEEPRPTPLDAARRALSGRIALLLFDGAEDADNLRTALNIIGRCGVIVTSRQRTDAIAVRQDMRPLPPDDAVKLVRAWGDDTAAEDRSTTQICELVGGLPLAVKLVGRYLEQSGDSAGDYLAWLQEQPFDALHHGVHREESVEVLLHRSLTQLSEDARQLLSIAGVLAFSSLDNAVFAAALPDVAIRRPLNELVNYGLFLRANARYSVSHALIHTYVHTRLLMSDDLLARIAVYYTTFAREQQEHGIPGYAKLDNERLHVMRVMAMCKARKNWQAVSDLVWAVKDYLDNRGYWTERQAALDMGVTAARHCHDQWTEGAFLNSLGNTYSTLGQVETTIEYYKQALAIVREIGPRQQEGVQLGNLGSAYVGLGQAEQAIKYHKQALAIARETGYRQGEGSQLGSLGTAYRTLGQVETAIEYYKQALAIARETGYHQGEEVWLGNLGSAYHILGQAEQAIEYHKQALAIAREIGHRPGEGQRLGDLGTAYGALGQVETAIEYYKQALTIDRDIGYRQGERHLLSGLGKVYHDVGQVETAIEYYKQALAIARETGCPGEEADLGDLGTAYGALGQVETAIEYYKQALAIVRETGYHQGEGGILRNLGISYRDLGRVEQAIEYYKQALAIYGKIKFPNTKLVRQELEVLFVLRKMPKFLRWIFIYFGRTLNRLAPRKVLGDRQKLGIFTQCPKS